MVEGLQLLELGKVKLEGSPEEMEKN